MHFKFNLWKFVFQFSIAKTLEKKKKRNDYGDIHTVMNEVKEAITMNWIKTVSILYAKKNRNSSCPDEKDIEQAKLLFERTNNARRKVGLKLFAKK